jgi:hypothetical protein
MRLEQPKTSYLAYVKAGLVFAASTAAFLLAKTTGFLPDWWRSDSEESTELTIGDTADSVLTSMRPKPLAEPIELFSAGSTTSLSSTPLLTDFQEQPLPPILLDSSVVKAAQRRLLQTTSPVTVQSSIPNQVIDASQQYSYSLNHVFSPGYNYLSAGILPSWLSLQYGFTGSLNTVGIAWDVAVQGSIAVVAADSNGLEIVDISNPAQPVQMSRLALLGYPYAVAIQGSVAAVAMTAPGSLQLVNISNPLQPVLLGNLSLPAGAQDLVWSGTMVIVADTTSGLMVVSTSNPLSPSLMGSLGLTGSAQGVAVQGTIAYVADGSAGLRLVNVSNPSTPAPLGSYVVAGGDQAYDVVVKNSLAYVAYGASGLRIVNVTNSSSLTPISTIPAAGLVQAVTLQGSLAWVSDSASGVSVWNVSNPSQPALWGSYKAGGVASEIDLSGSLMIMAYGSSGLQIADLRTAKLTGTPTVALSGQSWTITVAAQSTNTTLVSDSFQLTADQLPHPVNTGLTDLSLNPNPPVPFSQAIDTSVLFVDPDGTFLSLVLALNINNNPTNTTLPGFLSLSLSPTLSGSVTLPSGSAQKVAIQGTTAYVAAQGGGVQVVSFTHPNTPTIVGSYALTGAQDIIVQNNIAYVAGGTGLTILNVANPTPTFLGKLTSSQALNGLALINNLLAWADNSGVQVVDVTNPTAPVSLGRFNTSGIARQVAWQSPLNNEILVADDAFGMQIWDVTTPNAPVKLGAVSTPGYAYSVTSFNRTGVAVGDLNNGLLMVNTTTPSNSSIFSMYSSNQGNPYDIVVQGSVAFVADYDQGLLLVDLGVPTSPRKLGSYNTPGNAYGVAVSGSTAVVAADTSVQVLDVSTWQLNANPLTTDEGNYALTLTVTDIYGGPTSVNFNIRVEGAPRINGVIPPQFAKVGQAFSYFITQGLITEPNFDTLSFSAQLSDGLTLPNWLTFNSVSATLTGVPQSSNVGIYNVSLTATDLTTASSATVSFILNVNYLPALNLPISNQVVGIDTPFQWNLPPSTFTDSNTISTLSYGAQLTTGQPLPSWITFDNFTQSFSGFANSSLAGSYDVSVIVTDAYGGQANGQFTLLVEPLPQLGLKQSSLVVPVGALFSLTLSSALFVDANPLTYSAQQASGAPLPSWLTFNPVTASFSGVPTAVDQGVLPLRITATDPFGGSTSTTFNVTVRIFPQTMGVIPTPPRFRELKALNFTAPTGLFTDADSKVVLTYNATLKGGDALPGWLSFNPGSLTFSGWPLAQDEGTFNLEIVASDGQGGTAQLPVTFYIDPNYPPDVSQPVSNQVANIGELFSFFVPPGTFTDRNGDSLIYSARQITGENLPGWLSFNNQNGSSVFSGTPGRGDTNPISDKIIEIALAAGDGLAQTTTSFSITVQGTSTFGWFLKIGGPLLSFAGVLLGAYANRALCYNRYKPQRYQKQEQTAVMGQEFKYTFNTPLEKIHKLQVKLPHDPRRCFRLFKHPGELFKSSRDKLPGGFQLPYWLEYDMDSNTLQSKYPVPEDVHYNALVVQVKDRAGIILEQFTLKVVSTELAPILSSTSVSDEETPSTAQESKTDVVNQNMGVELLPLTRTKPTSSSAQLIYNENRRTSRDFTVPSSPSSSSAVTVTSRLDCGV